MKPDTLDQLHGNSPKPVSAAEALKFNRPTFWRITKTSPLLQVQRMLFQAQRNKGE